MWGGSFKKPMPKPKKHQKPKSAEEYVIRVEEEAKIEEEVKTEVIKRKVPKLIPMDTIVLSRKNKKCNECKYKTDKSSNLKRHQDNKHNSRVCAYCMKTFDCYETVKFHQGVKKC